MSRAKQRADRIRDTIPILQLLQDYGYEVMADGGDREQQFCCDLHGDGRDSKPSARVYPETNSWYCWACGRSRDHIQTCREKESLDFWKAIEALERKYRLPFLPWDDSEGGQPARKISVSEQVLSKLTSEKTYEEEVARVERLLQRMSDEKEVPMNKVLAYWEALDCIKHKVIDKKMDEGKGKQIVLLLLERALGAS